MISPKEKLKEGLNSEMRELAESKRALAQCDTRGQELRASVFEREALISTYHAAIAQLENAK